MYIKHPRPISPPAPGAFENVLTGINKLVEYDSLAKSGEVITFGKPKPI